MLVSARRRLALAGELEALRTQVELYVAEQAVMDQVCGFPVHRGLLAYGRRPCLPSAAELLAQLGPKAIVVCAVGLNDVDNIGAIFRNSAAFGVDAVLLDATCCDPLYRRAIRVSVGAALTTPFARLQAGEDLLACLHRHGLEVVALSPGGATPLKALQISPQIAVLVGAEGPGLPEALLARAHTVRIPMAAGFDSLNVATALAVALHPLRPEPSSSPSAIPEPE